MAENSQVTYDSMSFIIGGRRVFISSGAVHYFRSPHESWRDLLLKTRFCGLNAVETYVAWNFHEYEEGRYDFTGDRDLPEFMDLCEELGLYAILRPGPYICAEWDFGGFPWWLAAKEGVRFRVDEPVYLKYVDRWFDRLIPIIAEHQYTRGGCVIAVQVENEYAYSGQGTEMAEKYQGHLRDGMRARGIDVPLLTCAGGCSGTIECANAHRPSELFPELRARQSDKPLFSTEFWGAWYDTWGREHQSRDPYEVYRETLRIAATGGAGYNYYMWHGGTNFGYTTSYLQTTSYDIDAMLSEAGWVTDKAHLAKCAAHFLQTVAPILTNSPDTAPEQLALPEGVKSWARQSDAGSVIFLENTLERDTPVQLPSIPRFTMHPGELAAVTQGLRIARSAVLTYTSAIPFGVVQQKGRCFLFVYGPDGGRRSLAISVQGVVRESQLRFSDTKPVVQTLGSVTVIAVGEKLAGRTWFLDDERCVLIGPGFATDCGSVEGRIKVKVERPACRVWTLRNCDFAASQVVADPPLPDIPTLSEWVCAPGSPEAMPDFDDSGRLDMDAPKSMLYLDNGSEAYGWYRAQITMADARRTTIRFLECADILTLFVNGRRVGASPAPPENRKSPWGAKFRVSLRQGRNTVAVLADNLGLAKGHWQIGKPHEQEAKGIFGPVTLADGTEIRGWRFIGRLNGERLDWTGSGGAPWQSSRPSRSVEWRLAWWKTTFSLPEVPARPIFLDMSGMTKGVIWINGRNLGRYWSIGPQRYYYVPAAYLGAENDLVLVEEGTGDPRSIKLVYDESGLPYR